ncbi:MAG: hypothetical protein Q8Q09_01590 [Deltaproteobacteria bacterium]|nr:hypothetical protein [Deltaproteobacteria bacterium]
MRTVRQWTSLLGLTLALSWTGCAPPLTVPADGDTPTDIALVDASVPDSAVENDVAEIDASAPSDSGDASAPRDAPDGHDDVQNDTRNDVSDAGPREILGTLSGPCGTLRTMLRSTTPSLVENALVFMAPERYVRTELSPGGQRLFDMMNAGGSSTESEVMSFEVLRYCENADLVKTETEILYAPPDGMGANSITDILVRINGDLVGVSVTRAYRPVMPYFDDAEALRVLTSKLSGVNRSSVRVLPADRWVKQILHVFAANMADAMTVQRVWATLSPALRADTIVLVTVTQGGGFVYCNPDPPLGMECPRL